MIISLSLYFFYIKRAACIEAALPGHWNAAGFKYCFRVLRGDISLVNENDHALLQERGRHGGTELGDDLVDIGGIDRIA